MKNTYKLFRQRVRLQHAVLILTFLLSSAGGVHMPDRIQSEISNGIFLQVVWADEPSEADIQWFRDEMKISPKFIEHKVGVWGMSWAHFITMIFLIIFFISTVAMLYVRHRQTKKIIKTLLKDG